MKPCRICKKPFTPVRPLQRVCGPSCAMQHARSVAAKKQAKEEAKDRSKTRAKLKALETKPQLVKKAQAAFNAYIRARDAWGKCISCDRPLGGTPNSYDAGHYRSVGSAPHMRFVETNVHGQCKHCNNYLGGNHVAYRQGLIERVGLAEVERLERDNTARHYTKEGLAEIAKQYRAMARKLRQSQSRFS